MDVPSAADRPERAPAVVGSRFGRPRQAVVGIEQVAFVKGVVQRDESAATARHVLFARRAFILGILHGERDVVHLVIGETFGCHGC